MTERRARPAWGPGRCALLLLVLGCKSKDSGESSAPIDSSPPGETETDTDTDDSSPTDRPEIPGLPTVESEDSTKDFPAAPYEGEITVSKPYDIPHAVQVDLQHPGSRLLSAIACEAETPSDAMVERVERSEPVWASEHSVALPGLLADTEYACIVQVLGSSGPERGEFTLRTDPLPEEFSAFGLNATVAATEDSYPGYTLFNLYSDDSDYQWAIAVDPFGQYRWHYRFELAQGTVTVSYDADKRLFLVGGGRLKQAMQPTAIDETGTVVQTMSFGDVHHDALFFEDTVYALTGGTDFGICVTAQSWPEGEPHSEWCTRDMPQLASLGDVSANSVAVREEAGTRMHYVTLSGEGHILKVREDTGELLWRLGEGLDFTGMDGEWTDWSHDVQVGDCEEGDYCLLYYDNGVEVEKSRAAMVAIDESSMEATLVRSWTEDPWYEPRWGGTDLLPNGNWLVGIGHLTDYGTDTPHTAIVEVNPDNEVVWRLELQPEAWALFRARRADACSMFHHTGFCAR